MIYVISEDTFFSIGMMATLDAVDIQAKHIELQDVNSIKVYSHDIVLLCTQSRINNQTLSYLAQETRGSIVCFVDANIDNCTSKLRHKGVISKKISKLELVNIIIKILNKELTASTISLSKCETQVMDMLAQQKNAHLIARILNISAKTVFSHKSNALNKMGFSHLNARSVLLYESVFQTRVYL